MTHTRHSFEENPTIFGKLLRKEIPSKIVYEDEFCMAFHDIAPKAPVHVVIVPKQHLISLQDAQPADAAILGHILTIIPKIAEAVGVLESGFRLITNAGANSGQEVPHLHFHLLGGKNLGPKIIAD